MKKIQWWKPHSWYREIAVKQGLNPDPIKVARLLEEATGWRWSIIW